MGPMHRIMLHGLRPRFTISGTLCQAGAFRLWGFKSQAKYVRYHGFEFGFSTPTCRWAQPGAQPCLHSPRGERAEVANRREGSTAVTATLCMTLFFLICARQVLHTANLATRTSHNKPHHDASIVPRTMQAFAIACVSMCIYIHICTHMYMYVMY